jgi:hypothetical protein
MSLKEKMSTVLKDIQQTSHDVSEASKEMYKDVKTQWEGSKMQAYWHKGVDELKVQYVKLREKAETKAKGAQSTQTPQTTQTTQTNTKTEGATPKKETEKNNDQSNSGD